MDGLVLLVVGLLVGFLVVAGINAATSGLLENSLNQLVEAASHSTNPLVKTIAPAIKAIAYLALATSTGETIIAFIEKTREAF